MKTSYFWKATHEPVTGTKYVSISRGKPRDAGNMPEYQALMPSWDIINMSHRLGYSEESLKLYCSKYYEQLKTLDAEQVYNDLKDSTIVCYESARDIASGVKFCHRRMVAGWIESELGILIPEELREKDRDLIVPSLYQD